VYDRIHHWVMNEVKSHIEYISNGTVSFYTGKKFIDTRSVEERVGKLPRWQEFGLRM
jgi:uncharacterized protein YlzI (FlbEa/FlbD family)